MTFMRKTLWTPPDILLDKDCLIKAKQAGSQDSLPEEKTDGESEGKVNKVRNVKKI